MSKRYSSRDQEQHFEPRRIQILKQRRNHYSRGANWFVVIRNMVTGNIEQWYAKLWNEPDRWLTHEPRNAMEKGQSLDYAKQQAQELRLAFDLAFDVDVPYDDIVHGPGRTCILCGATLQRGREPEVCQTCRAYAKAGGELAAERTLYRIVPENLMPKASHVRDSQQYQNRIGFALLSVAGVMIEDKTRRWGKKNPPTLGSGYRGDIGSSYTGYDVHLTECQFEGMRGLIQAVLEYGEAQRAKGRQEGSSLLHALVEGKVHPDTFSDLRRQP